MKRFTCISHNTAIHLTAPRSFEVVTQESAQIIILEETIGLLLAQLAFQILL